MEETGAIRVAVIMQRLPLANRWQPWQWKPMEIVEESAITADGGPRCLLDSPEDTRWMFGDFEVELFRDEAEGYFLNVGSPTPSWFVMWRAEEGESGEIAVPKTVTLSYNEASRLMDGGERVDILPAPQHVVDALRGFVEQHYRPEPKRKRRRPSFEGGAGVDEMARAEQDQNRVR